MDAAQSPLAGVRSRHHRSPLACVPGTVPVTIVIAIVMVGLSLGMLLRFENRVPSTSCDDESSESVDSQGGTGNGYRSGRLPTSCTAVHGTHVHFRVRFLLYISQSSPCILELASRYSSMHEHLATRSFRST